MKRYVLGYLAAGLVLAGLAASAHAAQATEGIVIVPGPNGMTVYTVPPYKAPVAAAPASVAPVIVNIIIYPRSLRHIRYHRAFGHRYTGFIKMYSGNPYPF
jgi:hypothetical protein